MEVNRQTAAQLALTYVGSFPNQPHEPDILLEQVTQWCFGKPASVLEHMNNPNHGAITKSDKPCLKSLNAWFEDWVGKQAPRAYPEFKALPEPEQEPPEVRKAAVDRWRKAKAAIGEAVDSNCVGRPKGFKPIQREHSLEELMATVERGT